MTGISLHKIQQRHKLTTKGRKLINSKTVFTTTMVVALLTILGIWLFGLGQHRTLFENSILSTSILSTAFFLFLSIGLYQGIKLKDDLGKISDQPPYTTISDLSDLTPNIDLDVTDVDDGIGGMIISFFLWIIVSILLGTIIWLFGTILWAGILIFMAMLYWIFFRALRLVFKNFNKCKGDLAASCMYGLGYTLLYNFWIYGIILSAHYLIN